MEEALQQFLIQREAVTAEVLNTMIDEKESHFIHHNTLTLCADNL